MRVSDRVFQHKCGPDAVAEFAGDRDVVITVARRDDVVFGFAHYAFPIEFAIDELSQKSVNPNILVFIEPINAN